MSRNIEILSSFSAVGYISELGVRCSRDENNVHKSPLGRNKNECLVLNDQKFVRFGRRPLLNKT